MKTVILLLLVAMVVVSAGGQEVKKEDGATVAVATQPGTTGQDELAATPAKPVDPVLQQRIEMLEQRISDLSTELKKSTDDTKAAQSTTSKAISSLQQFAQVSGQVFAFYSYTTNGIEGKDYNRFDVDRMYLTAKAQVFDQAKVQFTTDLYRNTATGTYYSGFSLRVKFAYVDYAPMSSLSVKLGVIPGVWSGFIDTYWKYRGLSSNITDRNGFYSSADIGASVSYALPGKMGDISGFMLNGSGYTSAETNRFKDFALRVSVSPFVDDPLLQPLVIAGYAYKGSNAAKTGLALPRNRFGALISYAYNIASIGVEYDVRKDAPSNPDTTLSGNGLSIFGEIKAPVEELRSKLSLVWRFDVYEPNVDKGADMQRYNILGLAYKPHERLTFILNKQWTKAESAVLVRTDNTKTTYDGRWFLNAIVNF
jgi:hypothetical protein